MNRMVRVLAACLYASITYVPAFLFLAAITDDLDNALLGPFIIVGYLVSLICVIVVGVPTYFLLEKHSKRSATYYAVIGFLVPLVLVLLTQPFGRDGTLAVALQSVLFGVIGLASALEFWWFAARELVNIEHQ